MTTTTATFASKDSHKDAIKAARTSLKDSSAEGAKIRQEITTLSWVGGRPPELPVTRDAQGHRTSGKRALKPYRRPETGPQRYRLWDDKRGQGWTSRHWLLALGFLCGRPYKSIEKKCYEGPSVNSTFGYIEECAPGVFTKDHIVAWFEGKEVPVQIGEAA